MRSGQVGNAVLAIVRRERTPGTLTGFAGRTARWMGARKALKNEILNVFRPSVGQMMADVCQISPNVDNLFNCSYCNCILIF